jgi:hypothetical protein
MAELLVSRMPAGGLFSVVSHHAIFSILLTIITMWNYNRLNKQKEAQCEREGIDSSRRDEFKDMGNESPLFRLVTIPLLLQTKTDKSN